MKKAQSISINTIVVAAIALIVMVLIMMIFTGNMSRFKRNTDSCENNGGTCIADNTVEENCAAPYGRVRGDYSCYKGTEVDKTKVCCVNAG
ncbi:MAG: hypothetical protein ABIJ34_00640 [archaeon]